MRFYKRLYVSPTIRKKKSQIVWKLKTGKTMPCIYCITLAQNQDMLEIYHNALLKQPYYKEQPPYIIGIAGSYQDAIELVQTMVLDAKENTGSYNVKKLCLSLQNS